MGRVPLGLFRGRVSPGDSFDGIFPLELTLWENRIGRFRIGMGGIQIVLIEIRCTNMDAFRPCDQT